MSKFSHRFFFTATFLLFSLGLFSQHHIHCAHYKKNLQNFGNREEDAGNLRSDTLDILKYTIRPDLTVMNGQYLKSNCTINFKSRLDNIDWINLDLLQFQIDSIKHENIHLNYTYSNNLIHVVLPAVLNTGDELSIEVYYQGVPTVEDTFGGFRFQNGYAYNIGVAFAEDPHNYGRAWFPCFDNFVERSAYDVEVLTNEGRTAYCGGLRTSVETVGQDSLLTKWSLEEEIPTYLASVAVTNYTHVARNFESISGEVVPIWLAARPADTTAMKQSFVNIASCSQGFENDFGLYRWPRVGFVLVPFMSGAMEHTTNIAYPRFAADGSLTYETLFAHELAHQWFGNLVTCRNAEDMWLNEGWASYSEAIFLENQYGPSAYRNEIRAKHKISLLEAHIDDGGRYPVSGVPTELTYGSHVYIKGADMAHTLRGYMGDNDFFTAVQAYMEEYQFRDVSSEDMRNFFQQYTDANLTDFFNDWIFQEGFPEFRVKTAIQVSSNTYNVIIDQNRHYNPELCNNVPMQLTVLDESDTRHYFDLLLSGEQTTATITLPNDVVPVAYFLNENDAISQAVLAESISITSSTITNLNYAELILTVANFDGANSVNFRVENHFAAANPNQTQSDLFISPDRWWNVYHNANDNAAVHMQLPYHGNPTQNKFYDPLFFEYMQNNSLNENDIVAVYRPDGSTNWEVYDDAFVNPDFSTTDRTGRVVVRNIKPGQYAWAFRTNSLDIEKTNEPAIVFYHSSNSLFLKPNTQLGYLRIYDTTGKLVQFQFVTETTTINTNGFSKGFYQAQWLGADNRKSALKFVVE